VLLKDSLVFYYFLFLSLSKENVSRKSLLLPKTCGTSKASQAERQPIIES